MLFLTLLALVQQPWVIICVCALCMCVSSGLLLLPPPPRHCEALALTICTHIHNLEHSEVGAKKRGIEIFCSTSVLLLLYCCDERELYTHTSLSSHRRSNSQAIHKK